MEIDEKVLNNDEYEGVQLEKLRKLVELNKLFALPGWEVALEVIRGLMNTYVDELLTAKELEEVFHAQGQILGLRTLENLPAYAQSEAGNIQRDLETWKTLREQKKGQS